MSDWKPYVNNRLIQVHDGFVVIKPIDVPESIPMCCPLCETMLRSRDDEEAFLEFECCHFCALSWAHPRRNEWKSGWRPDPEQVKLLVSSRAATNLVLAD